MLIIGVDPSLSCTGWGIVAKSGNRLTHIANGQIKTDAGAPLAERLVTLDRELADVILNHRPDSAAVEEVFVNKNPQSTLKLGQARGCAITACAEQDLPVFEYTANQVKQATVGKGHAAKEQVQHMIKILLCLRESPQADAADALAIALCHGHSREGLKRMVGVSGIRNGRLQ
jgi:crossover junction endodeoxyribonuclease RuvC